MTQVRELDQSNIDELVENGLSCAIFDIDGTISDSNIGNLYFFMKRREYGFARWVLWYVLFILFRYPYFFLLDKRSRANAQRAIYALYSGYQPDQIEEMAESLFAHELLPRIYPRIAQMIAHLRDQGITVILLSSNIEPIAQQYAAHFMADACYAVPLDKICGSIASAEYFLMFKEKKFSEIKGSNSALVVADSHHDLPILNGTQHPVIVTKKQKAWMREVQNASFIYV